MRKLALAITILISTPQPTFAALPVIGTIDKASVGAIDLNTLIANGTLLAIALGGLVFFAMLILGGLKYISSAGDEKAAASARATLTNAFFGLVIMVAAFLIAGLLFSIFQIPGISIPGITKTATPSATP